MNPAARLLAIYNKLVEQPHDYQMVETWADVFNIDKHGPHWEDDVTACIVALRAEIAFTRQLLDAHEVPAHLTSPGFNRLRDVAAPGQLLTKWHGHRGNIHPPECRKVFEWAAWALREDDEVDMPVEEMTELRAELESLEAALKETEMSPYLRDFIQRQVNTIRAALQVYGVQGVRPLREALEKVAGAYKTQEKPLAAAFDAAPAPAKGLLAKASVAVDKAAKLSDRLSKIKKAGEDAMAIGGAVGALVLPYASKFLGGG